LQFLICAPTEHTQTPDWRCLTRPLVRITPLLAGEVRTLPPRHANQIRGASDQDPTRPSLADAGEVIPGRLFSI